MAMTRPRGPERAPFAIALATVGALVAALVLSPANASVEAAGLWGALRAPGQAGVIAAHRGEATGAPENTLPAFAAAIAAGVTVIETDVQLTADGVPILMHDFTLDRTTDGTGPVWAATWEQVRQLDAGSWAGDSYAGTPVPLFEQFLDLVSATTVSAIVELKGSWSPQQVELIAQEVLVRGLADRLLFASFDLMTLRAALDIAPQIPRAIISREINGDPADLAEACGAIAIVTSKAFIQSQPEVIDRIHAAGLGALVYTLNDADVWAEAIALGVDGLITDAPLDLAEWAEAAAR
jgi:glycerophosphoryl diester phosphodiesterase